MKRRARSAGGEHRAQVGDGDFWCISRNFSGNGVSVRKASKSRLAGLSLELGVVMHRVFKEMLLTIRWR